MVSKFRPLLVSAVSLLSVMVAFRMGQGFASVCDGGAATEFKRVTAISNNNTLNTTSTASPVPKEKVPVPVETRREFLCPAPIKVLPGGARLCGGNLYMLSGFWKEDPSLATSSKFSDVNACAPGKQRVYPYGKDNHGCCSEKTSNAPSPHAVFWPASSTTAEMENRIDTLDFLEAVRGKRILFLGDSISLVMFSGILMDMAARSIYFRTTLAAKNTYRHDVFVPSHNATLKLAYHYELEVPLDEANENNVGDFFLSQQQLSSILRESDIIMANVGLHNWPFPSKQGRQMMHMANLVEQEQQQRNDSMCLLWRRTLPQHFPTERGTGEWAHRWANYSQVKETVGCQAIAKTWEHPSDQALEAVRFLTKRGKVQAPVVDYTSIFQDASAFHSSTRGDCTHYCYSPRLWAPVLQLTAEAIRHAC